MTAVSPTGRTCTEGVCFYVNPKPERSPKTWETCIPNRVISQDFCLYLLCSWLWSCFALCFLTLFLDLVPVRFCEPGSSSETTLLISTPIHQWSITHSHKEPESSFLTCGRVTILLNKNALCKHGVLATSVTAAKARDRTPRAGKHGYHNRSSRCLYVLQNRAISKAGHLILGLFKYVRLFLGTST